MKTIEEYVKSAIVQIFEGGEVEIYSPNGNCRYKYKLDYPGMSRKVLSRQFPGQISWSSGMNNTFNDLRRLHDEFESLLDEGWSMLS